MDKKELIGAILSKDAGRISEAKIAIKEMLNQRSVTFKQDASKFVARSMFESAEKLDETHTLNGPFAVGTVVTDTQRGKVGVVSYCPTNSGHPVVVHFSDTDSSEYKPEDIPRLKANAENDTLPAMIQMLQGKFKGAK